MKLISIIIYQIGFLSIILGCNTPPVKADSLNTDTLSFPPFYKRFEGKIGNRNVVLYLMKTGQISHLLFVGHYYYTDDLRRIYFEGEHHFYPRTKADTFYYDKFTLIEIPRSFLANSYTAEQSLIDSLHYESDTIELGSFEGRFKGNFKSDSTFIGVFRWRSDESLALPFEFKLSTNKTPITFDMSFMHQKDTVLKVGNNKNAKVDWSLDMVKPMINGQIDTTLQNILFKQLTHCKNITNNLSQINSCMSQMLSNRFDEFKKRKSKWFKFESLVLPIYNEKKILSFFLMDAYDTERRNGYRSSTFSYNTATKQVIKFDDIFKKRSKNKISDLIKKSNRFDQSSSVFNENNFYITHNYISFIISNLETNDNINRIGQEFNFTFNEIKDLMKPTFWDILK